MDGVMFGGPADRPRKLRLVNDLGDFDQAGLVAWLADMSCWKSYAQDEHLEALGIREGDLLISDPTADIGPGDLVVMVDVEMGWNSVAKVERDGSGVLWATYCDQALPLDAEEMLPSLLLGFVPMGDRRGEQATDDDLLLARRIPAHPPGATWDVPSHYAAQQAKQDTALRRLGLIQDELPY